MTMLEEIALQIAFEIMELTAEQRITCTKDDINGDTWDRAMCTAHDCLQALKHPDEGTVEAMSQTSGMKEVDGMIAFCAARNRAHVLGYRARGEEAPLIQAWKAAIEHIQKGES